MRLQRVEYEIYSPHDSFQEKAKKLSTTTGFEPVLPEGSRFLIYRLNQLGHVVR